MDNQLKPGCDYTGVTVAFFCHDGRGNFVLHKRSEHCRSACGTWDFGGGCLEYGETLTDALFREISEEYGVSGEINEILPVTSHFFPDSAGKPSHWVVIPYIVQVLRDDVSINDPHSMTEIGWFRFNELPQPLHPATAKEVEMYKDYFKKYT